MKEVVRKRKLNWEVEGIESVDTMTRFWMEKTFTDEYATEMSETVFLCANPHSDEFLDPGKFFRLDEIWKYVWDEETGTCPAEDVTDKAIILGGDYPKKRLLVHYIQPHNPFINDLELNTKPTDNDKFIEHDGKDPWHRLEDGEVSEERVWTAYRENLEYVLDEVDRLLNNINAESVIITSDHGNAKGEWGLYGHPFGMPFRCLRTVPWIKVSATDSRTCQPDLDGKKKENDAEVEKRLEDLGYK
jgi:arylsulfatase A-like enzyme